MKQLSDYHRQRIADGAKRRHEPRPENNPAPKFILEIGEGLDKIADPDSLDLIET